MKKIALLSVLLLILITSLIKNSTKEIEDKIFSINENIRLLKEMLGDVRLEYNFLSSPEKLTQYQAEYFQNNLKEIDINKIKIISINKNFLKTADLIKKTQVNE